MADFVMACNEEMTGNFDERAKALINKLGEASIEYSIKSLPSFYETAAPAVPGKTFKIYMPNL